MLVLRSARRSPKQRRSVIEASFAGEDMNTSNWARIVGRFFLTVVAMLVSVPPVAQIDLSGEWSVRSHEDPGQPPLGDYLGIPFNDAGRLRAETTAESIWGTQEYQCRPHSAPHVWPGVGG